jgi:hypothetical protein
MVCESVPGWAANVERGLSIRFRKAAGHLEVQGAFLKGFIEVTNRKSKGIAGSTILP